MKIIIIGNGYDLNLNLASSFGDFYKTYFHINNTEWDYRKIRQNFWSLMLFFKYVDGVDIGLVRYEGNSPNWMDVETFIAEILNNKAIIATIMETLSDYSTFYSQPIGKIDASTKVGQLHELKSFIQSRKHEIMFCNIYDFLFDELTAFEKYFMDYLESLDKSTYTVRSDELMGKLTNWFSNTYVISFNYTKLPSGLGGTNQVHGSLDEGNIIIGVDKGELENNDRLAMRFSKSWRQLSNCSTHTSLPLCTNVTEIVIFGHSLGKQDYSYFHSLFNFYDIYSSNIKLTFLYADFHINSQTKQRDILKDIEYRTKYIDSVHALLADYIKQSVGPNESDSFLTKIQLEGRLLVLEINDYCARYVKTGH